MSSFGNPLSQWGSGRFGAAPIEYLGIQYYLDLLTSEYRNSPKLNALLTVLLQKFDDVSQCLLAMDMAWDLDNAVGVQLDALGTQIGASRTVGFQPSGGVSPVLDDATYRILLKATVAQNHWDGTIGSLYSVWQNLFPGGRITIEDNQNMTATIVVSGSFTSIIQDLITNGYIVPRPQGVLYTYTFATLPIFGADLENAFIAGADLGHAS